MKAVKTLELATASPEPVIKAEAGAAAAPRPIRKSAKLAEVCYDIRGPVLVRAKQMEDEGHKIIKLNIGNLAAFGFDSPEEIQMDMIRNLPNAAGYSDSKGIFSARKAVMHYTQQKGIKGVTIEDIYIGNGVSELIVMAMNALLDAGDEVLVPAPDYPLWTAAVSLSGGKPVHYLCDESKGWLPDIEDMRAKINAEHARDRGDQPEQPDRRGVSGRDAEADRRTRPRARPDPLRRRGLRQGALRGRQAHLDGGAVRGRAHDHLQRPVEELPLLRLPRGLDGGVRRQAPGQRLHRGPQHAGLDAPVRQRAWASTRSRPRSAATRASTTWSPRAGACAASATSPGS